MTTEKPDFNNVFASQAPDADKPPKFDNYSGGWGSESRPNNGKPTIKGANFIQMQNDNKFLWMHQNGVFPYDSNITYADGIIVIKDGVFKKKNGDKWDDFNKSEITDLDVITESGRTQRDKNKELSKAKLGNKVLYETEKLSIDTSKNNHPQGACVVGDSLFVKISNGVGVVGTATEEFIIAEYNHSTGTLITQTQPIQTLGHHMLSGFKKDGKTYLVTSYQPATDAYARSGCGATLIEWNGANTTITTQWELLNRNQRIGCASVDENGEYIYVMSYYTTLADEVATTNYRSTTNSVIQCFKLLDLQSGNLNPIYSFDVENKTSDGWVESGTINGFSATKDFIYTINGGAYGNITISKHSVSGELIDRFATGGSRSARPYSERVTNTKFLYNSEPEDIFIANNKINIIFAENWYGAGEFVRFNGRFYMARYGMTGKSPTKFVNHWEKVYFTPTSYSDYDATKTYTGRNTAVSEFKRVIVEIDFKNESNFDLLCENSNALPNIINNTTGKVHFYGTLANSNEINFGQFNNEQCSMQMNMSIVENGIRLFDTRYPTVLSSKSASLRNFNVGDTSQVFLLPDDTYKTDALRMFGRYNSDSSQTTMFPYLGRFEANGVETAVFYRDGRFYNYSTHPTVNAKFINIGVEALGIYSATNATLLDTENTYMWFGRSSGGVHSSATFGVNHVSKTLYPPSDGGCAFGMSGQRWSKGWFQNINVGSLSVYTDNTAAKSGGLVAGDIYRTSTGVLMVVY